MTSKGFIYKLQDSERTMFITNEGISNGGVLFGIINHRFTGLFDQARFDSQIIIPKEDFVEVCDRLNHIASMLKNTEKKEQKFIAEFEEDIKEMKQERKAKTKKGNKKK